MSKIRTIQSALNSGEISPKLRGRTDIPRYQHGLELCRNAIPLIWGGAQRLPGTRFVATAAGDDVRLIDFPVSIDGAMAGYVLELGHLKLRIHHNAAQIKSGDNPYELVTPYPTSVLSEIRYTSSANVLYLFHPLHHPKRFYRKTSDTDWTLENIPFTMPYMRPPGSAGITITPSATIGAITLTANADLFTVGHVGLKILINNGICLITGVTDARHASATVDAGTPITVVDNPGRTLHDVLTINYIEPEVVLPDPPPDPLPPRVPVNFSFSVDINALFDGTIPDFNEDAIYDFQGAINSNKYLAVTPPTPLPDGVTVTKTRAINQLSGVEPDSNWREQAWSDYRGYPACGTFHEQRLVLAGSPTYPTYEWGSRSDVDVLDFTIGALDNDAWAFNLAAAATSIYHLVGTDSITSFTGDSELTVRGGSDSPLTPSNVQVKSRTPHGSGLVRPVKIGGEIYFVPPSGLKLRGFVYNFSSDNYTANDVAVIADHLVSDGGGIKSLAYAREPYGLLWVLTNTGTRLTLTLDKEQEVTAWASHPEVDARYISHVVTQGIDGVDQVWFAVQRLVGGVWHTSIEILDPALMTNSTVTASGSGITEVTGLEHLEGRLVDIKADGFYGGRLAVSGGAVTLPFPANSVEAGLPYRTTIKDLPLELANPGQTIQGTATAVNKIRVRLHKSQGCTVNGEQIPFRRFITANTPVDPFSGDKEVVNLGRGTDPALTQVTIEQDLPFDLTVLAIIKEVSING